VIRFAKKAEADLKHIDIWITKDNGDGVAARIVEAILTSIELLDQFPHLGRQGRRTGTRELPIPKTPYIVVAHLLAFFRHVWFRVCRCLCRHQAASPGFARLTRLIRAAQLWTRFNIMDGEVAAG
jgi:toxin ParE1/3/4